MRTAERGVFEILGVPAGALGTGAGGKMRHIGPRSGLRYGHNLSFQIVSLPLGGGVPPRCIGESAEIVKELPGGSGMTAAIRYDPGDHGRLMRRRAHPPAPARPDANPATPPHSTPARRLVA